MIICERCSTQNLEGSRYCDECGAALWLAGKSDGQQSNGSKMPGQNGAPTIARAHSLSGALASEDTASQSVLPAGRAHATLVIERGSSAGKKFHLNDQEANIGRWDADGGIFPDVDLDSDDPEAKVSRRHARISLQNGTYLIEDLGSTNGTFINRGHRLIPGDRHPLKDGDEIIVGKTFLRFRVNR
jgi:hypothetical protein